MRYFAPYAAENQAATQAPIAPLPAEYNTMPRVRQFYLWTKAAFASIEQAKQAALRFLPNANNHIDPRAQALFDAATTIDALVLALRKIQIAKVCPELATEIFEPSAEVNVRRAHLMTAMNDPATLTHLIDLFEQEAEQPPENRAGIHIAPFIDLICSGQHPNLTDVNRNSVLHEAVGYNHHSIAIMLLEAGADVHMRNEGDYCVLQSAIGSQNPAMIALIQEAGGDDPNATSNNNQRRLLAFTANNPTIRHALRAASAKAPPNHPNKKTLIKCVR